MKRQYPKSCTAFASYRLIATGPPAQVALRAKALIESGDPAPVLIFDDLTGEPVELDLRGTAQNVLAQFQMPLGEEWPKGGLPQTPAEVPAGPGRPKLGVIGREVTLLPRHWDWLGTQPGGASVTLRKVVEAAMRSSAGSDRARLAQEAIYRFMNAMTGNLPGFEEATRILFSKKRDRLPEFEKTVRTWPVDIRRHITRLLTELIELEMMAVEV